VVPLGRDGDAHCGSGEDLAGGDYYDGIGLDCETVWTGASPWRTLRADSSGHVSVTVRCAWRYRVACRGTARIVPTATKTVQPPPYPFNGPAKSFDSPGKCHASPRRPAIGSHRFRIRSGRVNRVVVALGTHRGRAPARAACTLVRIDVRAKDPRGYLHESTRSVALRR
jgi:hypothetical protein